MRRGRGEGDTRDRKEKEKRKERAAISQLSGVNGRMESFEVEDQRLMTRLCSILRRKEQGSA